MSNPDEKAPVRSLAHRNPQAEVIPAPPAPEAAAYPGYAAYGYDPAGEMDGGSLFEYWRILRRRKGAVILIAFLGALLGFLITLPQTRLYQATSSLEIQSLNDNFLFKDVNPVDAQPGGNLLTDIQTQIKILQSESLLDRTVRKLKLSSSDQLGSGTDRLSAWRRALNRAPAEQPAQIEDLRKAFRDSLKVRASGQTRIVEVSAE